MAAAEPEDASGRPAHEGRTGIELPPLRDVLYTALGLGVLTFQDLQVRRRAVERQVKEVLRDAGPK